MQTYNNVCTVATLVAAKTIYNIESQQHCFVSTLPSPKLRVSKKSTCLSFFLTSQKLEVTMELNSRIADVLADLPRGSTPTRAKMTPPQAEAAKKCRGKSQSVDNLDYLQ